MAKPSSIIVIIIVEVVGCHIRGISRERPAGKRNWEGGSWEGRLSLGIAGEERVRRLRCRTVAYGSSWLEGGERAETLPRETLILLFLCIPPPVQTRGQDARL